MEHVEKMQEYLGHAKTSEGQVLAYTIANYSALASWVLLALLPELGLTRFITKLSIFKNCVIYAFYMLPHVTVQLMQDFSTWEGVLKVFKQGPESGLLAAWIHFLAFDLAMGLYIAQDARKNNINRFLVIPFLFATLMFGPVGLGAWFFGRIILGAQTSWLSFTSSAGHEDMNSLSPTKRKSKLI